MLANQQKVGFLGQQEFYNFLKLVTVAQSKHELTPYGEGSIVGTASAKIPAPQINLAVTSTPKAAAPALQMDGITSVASQSIGIRLQQMPGNASTKHQYFPSQQNQFVRPQQSLPPNSVFHTPEVRASGPMTQNEGRGVSPPSIQDGFGLTASGLMHYVRPRPQLTTEQTPSSTSNPQGAAAASYQSASKDSKISGNEFASASLFGDVFSATSSQPAQRASSAVSSTSSLLVSLRINPSCVGPQPSVMPSLLTTCRVHFLSKLLVSNQQEDRHGRLPLKVLLLLILGFLLELGIQTRVNPYPHGQR